MENQNQSLVGKLCGNSISYMRRFLFDVLSVGPIPNHIAFILDGNRRYARKYKLGEGMGHRAGFLSLMSLMKYCYELGIKYITLYAFSIDNFRRKPHEVQYVMDLMLEKIEGMLKEESIVEQYGVRVYFIGNLKLLDDTVRNAAEKAMKATAKNNKAILLICVAYTSTDEIVHAAQESCEQLEHEIGQLPGGAIVNKITEIIEEKDEKPEEKKQGEGNGEKAGEDKGEEKPGSLIKGGILQNVSEGIKEGLNKSVVGEVKDGILDVMSKETKGIRPPVIKLSDIETNMYMGVAPDVDILVRSSGETRLSNFLLWQTWNGLLYSPKALWPEVGLKHLVWAILNFQRAYPIFEKRKKQF
ncbi:OLC1v1010543C1 [Oldenlandia corymbosa var. corymbosa]|uniref:Alkyl transferase n=1 Tax=Oldenlandia corymbosa var. corymbosa TaxID=529605 RepID=A0AAV1DRI0_OLDCO|nr:OLC1v1010543C1 [Oldenlandia corymbosa var. corymbosa]